MDKTLLDILCCPVTRLPLEVLDDARLHALNSAIGRGELRNAGEQPVTEPWDEALITRDGQRVYPVQGGIPILLAEEAVIWSQVAD